MTGRRALWAAWAAALAAAAGAFAAAAAVAGVWAALLVAAGLALFGAAWLLADRLGSTRRQPEEHADDAQGQGTAQDAGETDSGVHRQHLPGRQ